MANFKTAIAAENEIMKAQDVTFGYDSAIENVAVALKAVLSGKETDFVVGGKVVPYGAGGMNVSIEPVFAFCNSTQVSVVETEKKEPISFEEADSLLDRVDIIQVAGDIERYDQQSRMFNDPSTGTKTAENVFTKKRIRLNVVVKKGSTGSELAPLVDSGFVKLAEVKIPAGTTSITEEMISNVSARKSGVSNSDWSSQKQKTFNPGHLADIFHTFLESHEESGMHKAKSINANAIDFGTESDKVKGSIIPSGQSMTVRDTDFTSLQSITDILVSLSENVNELYRYANNLLSRFSFISAPIVAASTANIDIEAGGEQEIDGVMCSVGQLVFLKDQDNKVENGFYEVQTGAWNRYAGYTKANPSVFENKFIFIEAGVENKGKIFYLAEDIENKIGDDELDFIESKTSSFALPHTYAIRDDQGRMKATSPKDEDDVAIKQNVTDLRKNLNNHGASCDGRNLLTVLGVSSIAEAMAILSTKCNGEGQPDWSDLQLGDYLDIPSMVIDGTTYTHNSSYQNLRIVISGFNQYINCGDSDYINTKNHILWTFRNIVMQKRMNSSNNNAGGYPASELKTFLDSHFASGLGNAFGGSQYLYEVERRISTKEDAGWFKFKVFPPTEVEVFGSPTYGDDQELANTNVQFPIFAASSFYRIKKLNGARAWWWEGTPNASSSTNFCSVTSYGNSYSGTASRADGGVAPAFCTC